MSPEAAADPEAPRTPLKPLYRARAAATLRALADEVERGEVSFLIVDVGYADGSTGCLLGG